MSRDEVKRILAVIDAAYQNFKVDNATDTLDAWHFLLADYDYNSIAIALKTFIATSGSAFAPSIAELIALTHKADEMSYLGEQEAWDMVHKALRNGAYGSRQEFEKLPPVLQKAVGSPEQLRRWAIDPEFNASVESSNFKRQYRKLIDDDRDYNRMPVEMKMRIEQNRERMLLNG